MHSPVRIALIHAVRVAIQPVEEAFVKLWPEAERINLLDDSLSPDLERNAGLTESMFRRINALADFARGSRRHCEGPCTVLTSPQSAVLQLRGALEHLPNRSVPYPTTNQPWIFNTHERL